MQFFARCLVILFGFNLAAYAASPQFQLIRKLSYAEISTAQLYHSKKLWVGMSRLGYDPQYVIELYTPDGKLLQHYKMAHSLDRLYTYGDDTVLAIGRVKDGSVYSYYSILQYSQQSLKVLKQKSFSADITTQFFAGKPNEEPKFFGAPGGSDTLNGTEIFGADKGTRSVFTLGSRSPRFLLSRFGFLKGLAKMGNNIYVLEALSIGQADNIVRLDLTQPEIKYAPRLLTDKAYPFIEKIEEFDPDTLVAPVSGTGEVLFVDVKTQGIRKVNLHEYGAPVEAKKLGRCAVVATKDQRKVIFYDMVANKVLKVWDYSAVGEDLVVIRTISIDQENAKIYVKGVLPWNIYDGPAPGKRNSVSVGYEADRETFNTCLK